MNLTTEITEAIQRDLPRQIGDQLKKRLEVANKLEEELKEKTAAFQDAARAAEKYERKLRQAQSDLEEAEARTISAEELEQRQRNLKVYELEIRLQVQSQIAEHYREVNLALTRNLEYRKRCTEPPTVYGGDTYYDGHGNEQRLPLVPVPGSESTSETVE